MCGPCYGGFRRSILPIATCTISQDVRSSWMSFFMPSRTGSFCFDRYELGPLAYPARSCKNINQLASEPKPLSLIGPGGHKHKFVPGLESTVRRFVHRVSFTIAHADYFEIFARVRGSTGRMRGTPTASCFSTRTWLSATWA